MFLLLSLSHKEREKQIRGYSKVPTLEMSDIYPTSACHGKDVSSFDFADAITFGKMFFSQGHLFLSFVRYSILWSVNVYDISFWIANA